MEYLQMCAVICFLLVSLLVLLHLFTYLLTLEVMAMKPVLKAPGWLLINMLKISLFVMSNKHT
ncbi:hypothetical protein PB70LOC_02471 [Pectobacterium versatile]|nr:hypothetical protein PB70LOC_02471 [Pectobacterium versatile]POY62594.1 hypothetical protein PB69LOC_02540 [Pectobacterium versatile]